jgi:hypothetical protein
MAEEVLHHLLLYTYVDDMLERRGPHRPGHLDRVAAEKAAGRIVMAGATGDPPNGGAIVWRGVTPEQIEVFVAEDPYQRAGLIASYRVERWTLV